MVRPCFFVIQWYVDHSHSLKYMYERVGYFYIKVGRTLIGMSCFFVL